MAGRAVFIDRDGTLNRQVPGYVSTPDELEMIPGAAEALRPLAGLEIPLILISNQQGIGKGLMGEPDLQAVEDKLRRELAGAGVELAAAYYCRHLASDGCECRKPLPGLILRAAEETGASLEGSFMVGDSMTDMRAGRAAGVTTVLVPTGLSAAPREDVETFVDYAAEDLEDGVRWICEKIASDG